MTKKVLLEVHDDNLVYDATGCCIGTWMDSMKSFESEKMDIKDLIRLKEAGFDSDEIIKMNKEGVI